LIFFMKKTIQVFQLDTDNCIKAIIIGNQTEISWNKNNIAKNLKKVKASILKQLNIKNLKQIQIDVIYSVKNNFILKHMSDVFLPCGSWQVLEFRNILPSLILKALETDKVFDTEICYDSDFYKSKIQENGQVTIEQVKKAKYKRVSPQKIADIYFNSADNMFSGNLEYFLKKLEIKDKLIEDMKIDINALKGEIQYRTQRMYELHRDVMSLKDFVNQKEEILESVLNQNKELEKIYAVPYFGSGSGNLGICTYGLDLIAPEER